MTTTPRSPTVPPIRTGVDPWRLSATALAAAYRRGELTPLAALESCWARLEATNPRLNAFVALRKAAAFEDAARSTERFERGSPVGPLDGIPLGVKDNIPTADLPTTWGCVSGRNHHPEHDELVVSRARAAGAILVGKTNVPEFTLEGYTDNRLFGTTRNPWDQSLTPGGSSGGSVAAVAAGMVPLALGTDGGGSTRRPASHTGLVGFKPSIGAIAREHTLPPILLDFEVIGTFGRDLADARLLFEAVRGPHAADRASLAANLRKPMRSRLRVRYVPTLEGAPVDPQVAASCRAAADRLATLGHEVEEGPLPIDIGDVVAAWPTIGQCGLAWLFSHHPEWAAQASPKYIAMAESGAALPASALWQILERVQRLRREVAAAFDRLDVLVTPAAAALPWTASEPYPKVIAGQEVGPRGHAVFTGWVNAAGLPAVAVPCEPSTGGLPIGVQLIGGYATDDALLALAEQLESVSPRAAWPPALD